MGQSLGTTDAGQAGGTMKSVTPQACQADYIIILRQVACVWLFGLCLMPQRNREQDQGGDEGETTNLE